MAWDSPLDTLAGLVAACAQAAEPAAGALTVQRLTVQTPVELQSYVVSGGEVSVGLSPPRQARDTTVMPVLHRIRIVLEATP
jgi:hypothetical protein